MRIKYFVTILLLLTNAAFAPRARRWKWTAIPLAGAATFCATA